MGPETPALFWPFRPRTEEGAAAAAEGGALGRTNFKQRLTAEKKPLITPAGRRRRRRGARPSVDSRMGASTTVCKNEVGNAFNGPSASFCPVPRGLKGAETVVFEQNLLLINLHN